ncbi:MAG: ATP-binding cassette domain-containing protein [Oscillospiraceae bacterium]|nr:ATP-binding cassette domain-containing protein [Oscillospiraceae bacterium]
MALLVDIEKKLRDFSLKVSFEADREVLALLGASGCGKSMTLKCIAGIEKPDQGRIELDGVVLYDSERHVNLPPQQRKVGYLFQQYALFPNMTVTQNIRCGVRDKKRAAEVLPEIIAAMHLTGLEEAHPNRLSGGQQQRVALARILVNEPQLLLLDEPFSALDSQLRFQLEEELRRTIARFGKTVLLVSHNRDEVFRLADRIAVMNRGLVEVCASKKALFAEPVTRTGAFLTGCQNISSLDQLPDRRIRAVDWGVNLNPPREADRASFVGIRMQDIRPAGPGEQGNNILFCKVEEEIENPFSVTVMLRCGEKSTALLGWELDKEAWSALRGETVCIRLPEESLLLLEE